MSDANTGEWKDRYYIISGGTQGLGRATALAITEAGAAGVAICGRNEGNGRRVRDEIDATGCRGLFVRADLAVETDCRRVVRAAGEEFGVLHGLVSAAGITDRGSIENTTAELWDRMMAVNVRAPFLLAQETVQLMKRTGVPGSIVHMISDQAHGGAPNLMAYAVSKGALATLTKNLAHALLRDRIRVNGILMGWMNTPAEDAVQRAEGAGEDWLEKAGKSRPFGRIIRPEEIARLAVYLLSDQSAMMTGSLIDFNQKVVGGAD